MSFPFAAALALLIVLGAIFCAFVVLSASRAERIDLRNKELAIAAASGDPGKAAKKRSGRLRRSLDSAGIDMEEGAFMAFVCAGALLFCVAGAMIAQALGCLLAVIAYFGLVAFLFIHSRNKRKGAFEAQLAESLPMIAEGIRGGMTFERAVRSASNYMDDPIRGQFKHMAAERAYGVSLPDAVENIAQRTGSRDMVMLSAVVAVNAQTGGNMADVIDSVATTIQSRARLRKHIASVTAQGRLSATVVTAIPVVLFLILMAVAGSYMSLLVTTPIGWAMIVVSALLIAIGSVVIRRLYKIRIY